MKKLEEFRELMKFSPELAGHISCEREFFLVDSQGLIVPKGPDFLGEVNDEEHFSYELSACQIEYKTGACKDVDSLIRKIENLEHTCIQAEEKIGVSRSLIEVAPNDMPLDVYPDPRYQTFAKTKSDEQLLAMLQVIACQFHIGMPDYDTAREVYNRLVPMIGDLCEMCDHSNGKRLELYKKAAPTFMPRRFDSIEDHFRDAVDKGYSTNLKDCHSLVRITRYGTIEFRMFGAAKTAEEIAFLAEHVISICKNKVVGV